MTKSANIPNIALQLVNMSFDCDTSESVTFKLEKFQVIIIGEWVRVWPWPCAKNNGKMVNYEGVEHQSGTTRTGC